MSATDRTLVTVAGAACVACCLPLLIAAGPVVAVGGAVAAATGVAVHAARKAKRKPRQVESRDDPS